MAVNPWVEAFIREHYPQISWALSHPELGPLLDQAAREGWSSNRIAGAVQGTNWYRTTQDTERQWEQLLGENPGEAARVVADTTIRVQQVASRLGIPLDANQTKWFAALASARGWDDQRVTFEIGLAAAQCLVAKAEAGEIGNIVDQTIARARAFLVPMSDEAAYFWGTAIATGGATTDGLDAHLRDQARSRFPTLASQIDAGFTVMQIFDPYIQQTASLLEISPTAVDLTEMKWLPMIDSADSSTGQRRPMSLSESAIFVRQMPEFKRTKQAEDSVAALAEKLMQTFGKVA